MNTCRTLQQILVVDDESSVLALLQRVLERSGYQVLLTANGDEATQLFLEHANSIALLLTDLAMPGTNGVEVWRYAKAIKPTLPVIVMSGDFAPWLDHIGHLPALGKPFRAATLLRAVSTELKNRAAQQGSRSDGFSTEQTLLAEVIKTDSCWNGCPSWDLQNAGVGSKPPGKIRRSIVSEGEYQ